MSRQTSTEDFGHPEPTDPSSGSRAMERHRPDNVALVFGVVFATIAAVSIVEAGDWADLDIGITLGATLLVCAVLLVALTTIGARPDDGDPTGRTDPPQ